MKRKLKVVVLMGGKSPEHEISLMSGKEIVKNLDISKFEILPVVISKDGKRWQLTTSRQILELDDPIKLKGTSKEINLQDVRIVSGNSMASQNRVDVVFVAMHGPFGEDGVVQGILEAAGVAYTGSGVLASALGMDKAMFRKVMQANNLAIPKYVVVDKNDKISYIRKMVGKPPYFVKPVDQGSSVGSSIADTEKELHDSLQMAFKYSDLALVDEYITGIEVTCGVIGNSDPVALPVTEIHPLKGNFFNYDSKYSESGAEEITPARISNNLTKKIQDLSIKVYKVIGCRGFARVDFIIKNNKTPVILEINTIPGLTQMSLLPKAAKAIGIEYKDLIEKIINYATEK